MVTSSTIDPPTSSGGSAASTSRRPARPPSPFGPSILCAENTARSAPRAWRSTGACGTDWQASSTVSAPTALARAASSATGLTVPSTFEAWTTASTLVRGPMISVGGVEVEPALVGDGDPPQRGTGPGAGPLPGQQVRVVLHLGDDDLIARAAARARVGVGESGGDEVQALGGVAGPGQLVSSTPTKAAAAARAVLVGIGRLLGERVRAAVHGRVRRLEERPLGVEDLRAAAARSPSSRGRPAGRRRARAGRAPGSRRGSRSSSPGSERSGGAAAVVVAVTSGPGGRGRRGGRR